MIDIVGDVVTESSYCEDSAVCFHPVTWEVNIIELTPELKSLLVEEATGKKGVYIERQLWLRLFDLSRAFALKNNLRKDPRCDSHFVVRCR